MNEVERLRDYLETGNTVTQVDAWRLLGIPLLAPVVKKLKRKGYAVESESVMIDNKFGEQVKVILYRRGADA